MFDANPLTLFLMIFYGIVGMGYFVFGKKRSFYFLFAGIGLMIFPYFVTRTAIMLIVGIILIVLPFILERFS